MSIERMDRFFFSLFILFSDTSIYIRHTKWKCRSRIISRSVWLDVFDGLAYVEERIQFVRMCEDIFLLIYLTIELFSDFTHSMAFSRSVISQWPVRSSYVLETSCRKVKVHGSLYFYSLSNEIRRRIFVELNVVLKNKSQAFEKRIERTWIMEERCFIELDLKGDFRWNDVSSTKTFRVLENKYLRDSFISLWERLCLFQLKDNWLDGTQSLSDVYERHLVPIDLFRIFVEFFN